MPNWSLDAAQLQTALHGVREVIFGGDRPSHIPRTRDLLHALGWGRVPYTQVETVDSYAQGVDLACTFWKTPVFFVRVIPHERIWRRELGETLGYAYNRAKDWALSLSGDSAAVYNVLWQSRIDLPDRQFRSIPYERVHERLDDLWLLTPTSFEEGVIQEQAELEAPTPRKMPITEKLLADLSEARMHLLDIARSGGLEVAAADRAINQLLSRLIFLRTAEDRGWALVPALRDVVRQEAPHRALGQIFEEAAQIYDAELFGETLPLDTWGPAVRRLITGLLGAPDYGVEYDFRLIDADLLGQTYERYLSAEPSEGMERLQLSLAGLGSYPVSQVRRLHGVYYTPDSIVDYITDRAFKHYFSGDNQPTSSPSVLDLSCGSGTFLVSAFEMLREYAEAGDSTELLLQKIYGADIDPRAVLFARLNLWLSLEGRTPLPNLEQNIVAAEALLGLPLGIGNFPRQFDIIIGNPPYRRIDDFPETPAARTIRRAIEEQYESAAGRYDISALFVERALNLLRPGGVGCMIVSNRLLTSKAARPLRRLLTEHSELLEIVDFTSQRVFPGVGSYTAILAFRKTSRPRSREVKVARVHSLGSFPERVLATVREDEPLHSKAVDVDIVEAPAGTEPWHLMTGTDATLVSLLEDSSVALSEVADLHQGVKTGANDLFLVRGIGRESTGDLIEALGSGGQRVVLERSILRKAVRRGIGYYLIRYSDELLIYPHRTGERLTEAMFREQYPRCWDYLSDHRATLEQRSPVRRGDCAWYELAWPREEAWLSAPKLLAPSMGLSGQFGVDWRGEFFPVGPTAVVPQSLDVWSIAVILNSPITFYYLSLISHEFRGGYVDFKQIYLKRVRVPSVMMNGRGDVIDSLEALSAEVKAIASDPDLDLATKLLQLKELEQSLTDLLFDLYRVPQELRRHVLTSYLQQNEPSLL